MERIILNKKDFQLLEENYPSLKYNKLDNTISGVLSFHRSYNEKSISGRFSIEFKLENGNGSILPTVRETKDKILSMAKRKMKSKADFHLNSENGDLCLIFPIKEKEHYPNGFEFERFLNHLETHLYWVTYYDRYDEKPWKDEPHNPEEAFIEAVKENKIYRKELKSAIERKEKRKLSRPEFRRYLKRKNIL